MQNKTNETTNPFWGIIKFEIKENGCLNGLWSNTANTTADYLFNEIARKKDNSEPKNLAGEYFVSWLEANEAAINGTLKIIDKSNSYELEWFDKENKSCYKGKGLKIEKDLLVAVYWKTGETITWK